MNDKFGLILLTGPPGVGKTTLVRKVCEELIGKHNILCNGFYTEEVRNANSRERIGFDLVTLSQERGVLARVGGNAKGPFVGKYCVKVNDFENLILPLLNPQNQLLLVIDEIGKMELKSKQFESALMNCLDKTVFLATVPYEMRQPLPLVEKFKNHPKAKIIVVTKENRNYLQKEIIENLLKMIKK